MSQKPAKNKKTKRVEINQFRRIALYINPVVMVILILCIFFGAPLPATIAVAVVGYGIFLFFLIKANMLDKKLHGAK